MNHLIIVYILPANSFIVHQYQHMISYNFNGYDHSPHILLSPLCDHLFAHYQRCHAEPPAADALPGCHGETSFHQLWRCQGWKGTKSLSTPPPVLQIRGATLWFLFLCLKLDICSLVFPRVGEGAEVHRSSVHVRRGAGSVCGGSRGGGRRQTGLSWWSHSS